MDDETPVWLISNGDYWKAAWRVDGRLVTRSIGAKAKYSKRQAKVIARRLYHGAKAESVTKTPRLSAWLETFAAARGVGAKTKSGYREAGIYLSAWFTSDPGIGSITRADAAEWRDAMATGEITRRLKLAEPNKPWRHPSASTVAKHVRAAKLIFQEAADRDLIKFNPFDRLKGAPPAVAKDWRQVTHADLARIMDACPSQAWRCLFALCRFTGLRLGEALRLRWVDVDFAGNRMAVNAELETATTKRRRRTVPIEPARCPSGMTTILLTTQEAGDGSPLVVNLSPNNVRRDALRILRLSGVGEYAKPFHTLRKCCETEWAGEYPQHVVSEWIGHDITVSAKHYLRVPEELFAPAVSIPCPNGKGAGT